MQGLGDVLSPPIRGERGRLLMGDEIIGMQLADVTGRLGAPTRTMHRLWYDLGDRQVEARDRFGFCYAGSDPTRAQLMLGIDDEDAENLKKLYTDAAYLKTVGGVGNYQKFAAGKAMMGAGEGMAKGGGGGGEGEGGGAGGLLGGAGLGVGFGLAQMLVRDQAGGERLAPVTPGVQCGSCGTAVSPGRFCSACGTELAQKPEPPPAWSRTSSSVCSARSARSPAASPSCSGAARSRPCSSTPRAGARGVVRIDRADSGPGTM